MVKGLTLPCINLLYVHFHKFNLIFQCDCEFQSRDGSSIPENWDDRPHTIDELKAMLQNRKEAALRHERNLSQALPEQVKMNPYNCPCMPKHLYL